MSECKGLVARYTKTVFVTKGKFESKESLNFLKRKSCGGCCDCGYMQEYMSLDADESVFPCTEDLNSGDIVQVSFEFSEPDYFDAGDCAWQVILTKIGG